MENRSTDCADGPAAIATFLEKKAGVDPSLVVLNDGQGATTNDLVTPTATVGLLRYWTTRDDFERFRASLPILGVDGSLALVQVGEPAAGHVFAKTGTLASGDLTNVRAMLNTKALAGYIDARDGRKLAFALYVNDLPLGADPVPGLLAANDDLGAIAAAIWRTPRG